MATSSRKTKTQEKPSGRAARTSAEKPSGKAAGKPGRPKKQPEPVPEPDSFIRAEVMIILSFALAVLFFLSNFHLCGVAGDFLRSLQLGIFGTVGFIAPLLLFVGTCFYLSNRGNRAAMRKLAASAVLVVTLCGFAQLFFGKGSESGRNLMECYRYSSLSGMGGGLVGGLVAVGLKSALGVIGAFLVLLVLTLICGVCITEKSLVNAVKKRSDAAYQHARADMDRRRELHAERQEQKRMLRQEQRVRGVDLRSTYLEPDEEEPETEGKETEAAPAQEQSAAAALEPQTAAADRFTGNITFPPEYRDEDEVPFDTEPEISAQELVAEGIARFEQEQPFEEEPDDLSNIPRIMPTVTHGSEREEPDVWTPPEEADADDLPEYVPEPAPVSMPESASAPMPEPASAPMPEPAQVHELPHSSTMMIDDEPPFDEPVRVRGQGGTFAIPEAEKRVVTAGGKVIETDTEALQKKLESRRKEVQESGEVSVQQQIQKQVEIPKKEYVFPPVSLLKRGSRIAGNHSEKEYRETAIKLQQTLRNFGVGVTVTNISCGPSVTRYELLPEQGVKVSKIVGLTDDIKLSLAAEEIRIEAPIPGKSAVGIEVPNKENNTVYLRDLLEAENFRNHPSRLAFAVGKDIGGQVVVTDIAKMPHLLIAGATGSGKSVCINTLIMSIIFKSSPDDVKLIMVDPKVVELSVYNGIPHLLIPVVTDPKKASGALNWAVAEMTDRYKKFAEYNVRDLKGYNAKIESIKDIKDDKKPAKLPQIIIIVDELADLMMVAPGEVEDAICRLAQLARAAGIHLVIATQRPSVNVITGLIKANIPSRIAFSVSSGVDSRTIIDMNGAEKLLGKGDMLFYPAGFPKPQRVQGAFVSDQEVQKVVDFLTEQGMTAEYSTEVEQQMSVAPAAASGGSGSGRDEYFEQAGKFIIEKEKASIGMLQRMFKIGFNRAARIMDQLAEAGVVGEEEGTKPRKVLMTMEEFSEFISRG